MMEENYDRHEKKDKRQKPFLSKQTRHEKGKKQKPGHPTLQRHVKGPEQFYFFGHVFTCKKEVRDRVKQLLISCCSFNMRPDPPGALNPSLAKSVFDHLSVSKEKKIVGDYSIANDVICSSSHPILFQHFQEIIQHHPNFNNWSNKNITFFKVKRDESYRKNPPLLYAHFSGNESKPRLVKWMKCLSKKPPTLNEKLLNALNFSSKTEQSKHFAATKKEIMSNKSCQRCSLNRPFIDHVQPSYPFKGPLFNSIHSLFLSSFAKDTVDQICQRLQWIKKKNAYAFHPSDNGFLSQWLSFNKNNYFSFTELLCETCRIESWVTSLHLQEYELKNKCRLD